MLRLALLQSARGLGRTVTRSSSSIVGGARAQPMLRSRTPHPGMLSLAARVRCYSAPAGLTKEQVEGRIMNLLANFDKVKDASKVTSNAHFANDLGLDSLDTVEVVMAVEEEFSIEIPDKEADAILSIDKAVEYILKHPDAT